MDAASRDSNWPAALLVGTLAGAFFLLQFHPLSDATIAGNDAVGYSIALESHDPGRILNGHHPLYHLLGWGLTAVIQGLAPGVALPGVWALRAVGAVGGAVALALLYHASRRWLPAWLALLATLFFASSAGMRLYASIGESYLPAYACQLALCLHLFGASRAGRPASVGKSIAWCTLACALRQDAVLVVPFAFFYLLCERPGAAHRMRRALVFAMGCAAATLLLYAGFFLIYAATAVDPATPDQWLLHLVREGLWGGWGGRGIDGALGISLHATATSWDYGMLHAWPGQAPFSLAHLLRWGILLLPFALPAILARRHVDRAALLCIGTFLLPRMFFFAWWQPGNMEYHSGNWIPLIALLAWCLWRLPTARLAAGTLLLLGSAWNVWSNEAAICSDLRARRLSSQAARCARWRAEGSRIYALDPWFSYALQRFGAIEHARLFPPTEAELAAVAAAEPGARLDAWSRATAARIAAECAAPALGGVAFARDVELARALGVGAWGIEHLLAVWAALQGSPQGERFARFELVPAGAPENCWALRFHFAAASGN